MDDSLVFHIKALICVTAMLAFLKLVGLLSWSWLAVFAPLWVPFVLAVVIVLIYTLGD